MRKMFQFDYYMCERKKNKLGNGNRKNIAGGDFESVLPKMLELSSLTFLVLPKILFTSGHYVYKHIEWKV